MTLFREASKATPAFRGNDGSAGLSVADFALDSLA
jgi:hypothetical protein